VLSTRGTFPRCARDVSRLSYVGIVGIFGEVLPCEDQHPGVVPPFERRRDLFLLAFPTSHHVSSSIPG
jgi:hypothetical protein